MFHYLAQLLSHFCQLTSCHPKPNPAVWSSQNQSQPNPTIQADGPPCNISSILTLTRASSSTTPVTSLASNLAIARSSDLWRLWLMRWQTRRFRSMDRPSSCTCRCRSRVTYLPTGQMFSQFVNIAHHNCKKFQNLTTTYLFKF